MFFFTALCLSKTPMVGSKRFLTRISKSPYSLVLFTTRGCGECDKILSVMDGIYDKFTGRVSMISVDVDVSPDLKKNYSVTEIPSVGVFSGTQFLHFYKGEWSRDAIYSYCEGFFKVAEIEKLSNVFEVFQFQMEKEPANLIVSDPALFEKAKGIAPLFPGTLNIAFIENETVSKLAGIAHAQIRRPIDSFVKNIDTIDEKEIMKYSKPLIELITNQEQLGISQTRHTLIALIDERDPLQKRDIAELWTNVSHHYEGNLSYQFCDFYRCSFITQQMGIVNFGNPITILSSRIGVRPKLQLFANPEPTQKELEIWLNKNVLGIEEPEDRNNDGLPRMRAHEFMRTALDPKRDIILLMAAPGMPKYKEARENAKMLAEIFQNIKGVEVYEFNPRTELVPGLQMPRTDKPMLSIWPATDSPTGANIYAAQPLPYLVDEIMKGIKTKIDPTMFKQIGEMITEFMSKKSH